MGSDLLFSRFLHALNQVRVLMCEQPDENAKNPVANSVDSESVWC
jgi:hypothetical protein